MQVLGCCWLLVVLGSCVGAAVGTPTLREAARGRIFVGYASNLAHLTNASDAAYKSTGNAQYDLATAENECKFGPTEPARGQFDLSSCDAVAANMIDVAGVFRGHNFVWGDYNPPWLLDGNFSAAELLSIMQGHISHVAGHYAGRFYCWDVVNEAVSDNDGGAVLKPMPPWFPTMGASYIDEAFAAAHKADPHARLFYNDYGAEGASSPKAARVLQLVKGLLARGVPIHGVGLQSHFSVDSFPEPADVAANMRALGELGLEVQITEMDVRCDACTPARQALQARIYAGMLSACLNVSACTSFETWGFTDKYSWLGTSAAPLPFDATYAPKPAFDSILGVLLASE